MKSEFRGMVWEWYNSISRVLSVILLSLLHPLGFNRVPTVRSTLATTTSSSDEPNNLTS